MNFDYKKYSLEQLETWINDAVCSAEASPYEIYDVIKRAVEEQYYYFKLHTERCYELLALLNGNGRGHIEAYDNYVADKTKYKCDRDDTSEKCQKSWNDFWEENYYPEEVEDKVVKWQLPVQMDDAAGDAAPIYYVNFPDDLLEAANLKEGDKIEWLDNGDGSYLLKKTN